MGCWRGCLSGAKCRQLYVLNVNSMTYTLFFIADYQFQEVFYVSLGNIFTVLYRPFSCGGPWATAQFAVKSGPVQQASMCVRLSSESTV